MNFFAAQDKARKNTALLVVFFLLAVLSLIIMSNLVVLITMGYLNPKYFTADNFFAQFDWHSFGMISVAIASVIFIGTLYKLMQLSSGGSAVAEMMGARLVATDTYDYNEKKLVNVVTEMAIASGTPVPAIYIMDNEAGINAFAAGYHQRDAVVAVTRGTLETLTRDELQGVIAHEFSHIFNGDMRINIRLIGILHGILIIGIIGYHIMRAAPRSRNSKGGAAPIAILGLGLMVVGYAGTFFGNLIKAAVSRQREFLADASAVQFTRNPAGIAGALKKIGGSTHGSMVNSPDAEEISHTFFGEAVSHFMNFMMSTHPPLEKRIRTIEPGWDGNYTVPEVIERTQQAERETEPVFSKQSLFTVATVLAAQDAIDSIGQPQQQHLDYARQLLQSVPQELIEAAQGTFSARAVIYFLLLSKHEPVQQQQIEHLMLHADDGVTAVTLRLSSFQHSMQDTYRLSLINIALASLQQLTQTQYQRFIENIDALIAIDNKIELFEWAIQKIIRHNLADKFENNPISKPVYKKHSQLSNECIILLSILWYAGHNEASQQAAFADVLASLNIHGELLDKAQIHLNDLNGSLDKLNQLYPLQKPALLKACASVITLDGKVTSLEAELFRAIAEILDSPMPPLLATATHKT